MQENISKNHYSQSFWQKASLPPPDYGRGWVGGGGKLYHGIAYPVDLINKQFRTQWLGRLDTYN